MKNDSEKEMILYKKYNNRRIYSMKDKTYVTLEDIEKNVTQGHSVKILDSDSEEDITSEILTQILIEKNKMRFLPSQILEQMIRQNESQLKDLWLSSMQQSLQFYIKWQKGLLEPLLKTWTKDSKK